MIIDRQSVEYSGNTQIKKQAFTVKDTVLISDLLSNMYTNPILACVREYLFNAIDSHVAANKPVTDIKVTAPTLLHSYFEVQDFGVGMSESEVYELMTSYGSSNKRQSNSLVGGFGIGSKAAFSYDSKFTFVATKDGVQNTFLCYIDGENGPQIERLSSTPTTEPNGIHVKIRVKSTDIQKFANEIQNIVKWLDVQPQVVGCKIEPIDYIRVGSDYKFYPSTNYNKLVSIRMGGVVYSTNYNSSQFKSSVVLDYPIGDFKLAPSRESIINTTETNAKIKQKLDQIYDELKKEFLDGLDKQPTLWTAIKHYSSFKHDLIYVSNVKWKKQPLYDYIDVPNCIKEYTPYRGQRTFRRSTNSTYLRSDHSFVICISEKKSPKYKQILFDYEQQTKQHINLAIMLFGSPKSQYKQWCKLGKPEGPVINLDTYELPTNTALGLKPRKMVEFKEFSWSNNYVVDVKIDVNDGVVRKYLNLYDNRIDHPILKSVNWYYNSSDLRQNMEYFGIKDNVVLVPKTISNRVPKHWVNLEDHINKSLIDFVEIMSEEITKLHVSSMISRFDQDWSGINDGFGRAVRRLKNLNIKSDFSNNYPSCLEPIVHQIKSMESRSKRINVLYSDIITKYPILAYGFRNPKDKSHYIQTINKALEYDRLMESNRYYSNGDDVRKIQPQTKEMTNV